MKYEPKNPNRRLTETEALMLPMVYDTYDTPELDEINDIVMSTISTMKQDDILCLWSVFYDRVTYEELCDIVGVRAKSHAWTKTQHAMQRLKKLLLENKRFMELTNGYN